MSFSHIESGSPLRVDCNEAMPIGIGSGQSVTLSYTIPNSPEPTGTWYGLFVFEDSYAYRTGTRGIGSDGLIYRAPAPGSQYTRTFSQADDGYATLIYGSWIELYPHNLPQVDGSANPTVCAAARTNLDWLVFDAASVTLVDQNGNPVPFAVVPTGILPGEDDWWFDPGNAASIYATVTPTQTTNYILTAQGFGGETASHTITVSIYPAPTVTLAVSSPGVDVDAGHPIPVGAPITLTWASTNAEYITLTFADNYGNAYTCYPFYDYENRPSGLFYPTQPGAGPSGIPVTPVTSGSMVAMQPGIATYVPPVIFSKGGTFTATANSVYGCNYLASSSFPVTLLYPTDDSAATAVISVTSSVGGGIPGGGASKSPVPRRSCLSAPGSRYCRAEDSVGGGISFVRAYFPVPKIFGGTLPSAGAPSGNSLWDVSTSVTTNVKDSSPALFLDQRGLLYCCFSRATPPTVPPAAAADTSKDGTYVKRSDDFGQSWGAHLDSNGTTEILMIPSGTLPAAASGNGSTLVAAIVGSDAKGYQLFTAYKSTGSLTFTAPVVAVDATRTPLSLQNSGIALCKAAEGAGRWVLSCLLKGDTATSEFWSADDGASWTKVATS